MGEIIKVGIAALDVCKAPDSITTLGLGSCVGVVLYDELNKTAGLVHVMLPDSTRIRENTNRAKFADTGVDLMIERLEAIGIKKMMLKAKIAGGAKMFEFSRPGEKYSIGDQNVMAVLQALRRHRIPVVAQDTGLNYGRTILFNPATYELKITSAGKMDKVI
ncbi:MAG: chemotaxis protein CheD [Lachnospiraceae bacterium]|nr:chemotaxis protein CheD [Lachnospiraceae bacterium]